MRKRVFTLILALVLLLSVPVVPVQAEILDDDMGVAEFCPCGCMTGLSDIQWQPWTGAAKEGHFYLEGDFVQAEQQTVLSDSSVVLDLRGYSITTEGASRLFLVNGYLHVLDTVGGGRMMAKTQNGEGGGVVLVEENEMIGPMFCLHSGTITKDESTAKAAWGGLVGVGKNATFRMKGGLLLNGYAESAYGGGAVGSTVSTSNMEILGGSIIGCSSGNHGGSIYSTGKVRLENCKIIGGTAKKYGGNIFISGEKSSLTMKNAVVSGGVSNATVAPAANKYGGGNIIVYSGATVDIEDSEIYGGYAACVGGNICFGRGTVTITDSNIYGGSCGELGENAYGNLSSAKITINGGTIDGGFHQGNSKLTLKGKAKITGTGLRLGTGTLGATALKSGAEIYVSGNKTFSGQAAYFKSALRTTVTASSGNVVVATADRGYCQNCNADVTWAPYGTDGATHIYLTADLSDFAETTVTDELVLDLSGFHITAPGRAFNVAAGAKLTIFDSVGNGSVTGSSIIGNAGTTKLYGGKYIYAAATATSGGGIVNNSGSLTIVGSFLDASAYNNTSYNGGAICNEDVEGVTMDITGIMVAGGKAGYGGGIYMGDYCAATIRGGYFTGGRGTHGGNIAALAATASVKGSLEIEGIRIENGEATTQTGNFYIARYDAAIDDSYITGGNSTTHAGNISIGVSTDVTYTNCVIKDGTATGNGGNVYGGGNSTNMKLVDCLVLNGKTSGSGGNLYLGNGKATISGGVIGYGTAGSGGGNINVNSDDGTGLTLQEDSYGTAPLVTCGTAAGNGGNIYTKGITNLNAVQFHNGSATAGSDLYVYPATALNLVLGADVTGTVRMNAYKSLLTEAVYGGAISKVTCNAEKTTFLMDGVYGNCGIVVKDGTMYVATTAVVDGKGKASWYMSNAEAVEDCAENNYVKLFTNNDLILTKDLYVDLNGKQVAVSGDYKFYGMDTTGDSYAEPSGLATGTSVATYDVVDAPNGIRYVAVVNEGAASYHRLDMKITGVTIRPSVDGMYYSAKWACDDTLQNMIDTYGVVASTEKMPDNTFVGDTANLWTTFTADSFENGKVQTGAVITGIMKTEDRTASQNNQYGRKPVYAKAYLIFKDGTTYVSNDNIRYSLYDVMKGLDSLITEKPIRYRKFNQLARNFYEKWKDMGMGSWRLNKIPDPGEDGVINVLMIGNSYNTYFLDELDSLARAAGVNMKVCSIYYSGCPFEYHYNWWINEESHYQYFEMEDGVRYVRGKDVSLEWCLAQREWDVITFGMGGTNMRKLTVQQAMDQTRPYRTPLYDYMRESFPNADLYFHQTWSYDLGYVKNYASGDFVIETVEQQMAYTDKVRQMANVICEENRVGRINTGDAWEIYRLACNAAGIEHNLTARLGVSNGTDPHAGDKSHDGDIGGGQYLNACVWFEILTGLDCRDTTYIPTYTYGGTQYPMDTTMAEMLQEAAHKAVTEILPTYPENAN